MREGTAGTANAMLRDGARGLRYAAAREVLSHLPTRPPAHR